MSSSKRRWEDLPNLITEARDRWPTTNGSTEHAIKIEEWDITDMFNNIPIPKVKRQLKTLIRRVKKISTTNPTRIFIYLGKDQKDDHISTSPTSQNCTTLTTNQLLEILDYDLRDNNNFTIGNCIIRQKKGAAQGGYISSEMSCFYTIPRRQRIQKQSTHQISAHQEIQRQHKPHRCRWLSLPW